jgi:hypothetical protein
VARPARTAHVAEERFYGREFALDVDEDRAVVAVGNAADHVMAMSRLRDSRAVEYSLDAAARNAVPVDERTHGHGE